jgi:citrate synthase
VLWHGVRTRSSEELRRGDTMQAARALIQLMSGCLGYLGPARRYMPVTASQPLAVSIAKALGVEPSERVCHAIDAMMVLCADYELTPANFTARVTASAGADLHACVAAGLCTHSGALTGQVCDKLEELLLDNLPRQGYRRVLDSVRRLGLTLYGFNPTMTPHGDPRAYWMLRLAKELKGRSRATDKALWFLDHVQEECGMFPGLQAGLVALEIALQLPRKSALALWAIARTAGQIAHVIEQRSFGYIVRPRARYIRE